MKVSYTVGLDVAKRNCCFHIGDHNGAQQAHGKLAANTAGLAQLRQRLNNCGCRPSNTLIIIEATGLMHVPWAEALNAEKYVVYVVNPLVARRACNQMVQNALRGNKTDRIDAAGLSELGRKEGAKLQRFRYASEPARFGLQRLETVHKQLRAQLTNLRKSYGSLLDSVFPELGQILGQGIHNKRVRALLVKATTAAAIRKQPMKQLDRAFGRHAVAVLEAARDSFGAEALATQSGPALQALLRAIEELEAQLVRLDIDIKAQVSQVVPPTQVQLLRSVRGIGPKTAQTVAAYLPTRYWQREHWQQNPSRRRAVAQIMAFMGGEPHVAESGQWRGVARMSKRGCEPMRTALFQSSFCGTQHDPQLAEVYARHCGKGKAHKVAISHVMRRQVQRIVAVLQSGQSAPMNPAKESAHASAN